MRDCPAERVIGGVVEGGKREGRVFIGIFEKYLRIFESFQDNPCQVKEIVSKASEAREASDAGPVQAFYW